MRRYHRYIRPPDPQDPYRHRPGEHASQGRRGPRVPRRGQGGLRHPRLADSRNRPRGGDLQFGEPRAHLPDHGEDPGPRRCDRVRHHRPLGGGRYLHDRGRDTEGGDAARRASRSPGRSAADTGADKGQPHIPQQARLGRRDDRGAVHPPGREEGGPRGGRVDQVDDRGGGRRRGVPPRGHPDRRVDLRQGDVRADGDLRSDRLRLDLPPYGLLLPKAHRGHLPDDSGGDDRHLGHGAADRPGLHGSHNELHDSHIPDPHSGAGLDPHIERVPRPLPKTQ